MDLDFNEYNLRKLLELALRFPGAVNFKALYFLLKTIIKKQGTESLTPKLILVSENPTDSTGEKNLIDNESESSDETDKEQEKEKKMVEMEKEIYELKKTVEQLANTMFESKKQPAQKVVNGKTSESVSDKVKEPLEVKENLSKTEEPVLEVLSDIKKKVSDEVPMSPTEDDKTKMVSDTEKKKTLTDRRFFWNKDDPLRNQKIADLKKEVESLKENDQNEIWTEMQSLKDSNNSVEKKFSELLQDFDTVMNGYTKLGMQMEELDKIVNIKIKMEDDLETLKEQVDKLDTYVFSGKHKPAEEVDEKLRDEEPSVEEEDDAQFVKGEVEKPTKDRKTHFARMVKNLMAMPEDKIVEIRQGPIQPEFQKVKPTTMKAYEKFMQAAQETRAAKVEKEKEAAKIELGGAAKIELGGSAKIELGGAAKIELEDTEKAEQMDFVQLQEQAEIPASEVITQDEKIDTPFKETVQRKFHRTAKAITLLQDMRKTQKRGRLVKAKEMEAFRDFRHREDEDHEQQLSAESFEISAPPSQQASIEHRESAPGKATLLFGDNKASQDLKEQIVMYIISRTEEMETKFMDKMHAVETSVDELKDENEVFREEQHVLKGRLTVAETNQNKFEGRLTAVEKKANLNDRHIEEMMIAIDKKADRSDVMQGMSKRDMSILEDRMLKINETTISDVEELRSFLKDYTAKVREELDEKVFGFDMDCRLEPLAGRLKKLEKMLKDVSLKAQVLEYQTMGPIEVKRYLHCEDGKRTKPLRRPVSNWTSATQGDYFATRSIYDDEFFDGETAEKIEADIQKRMEDAAFRDSKRFIGGAYTKTKVTRSK